MGMAPHTRKTYSAGDKPMKITELSTEALLDRKAIAERATPGPWEKDGDDIYTEWSREEYPERGYEAEVEGFSEIRVATTENYSPDISDDETAGNAAHIAANSPDVVIATIDELLRLREENERMQSMIAALARKVANLTREWAKAGNVDNSAEYWVSWARHDAKAARRAVEQNYADQLAPEG